ncbi:hypothetical protein CDAR_93001 [Caerostris darwini]|uniref:Uncharacterized protein n=1 Tax=Caerostris darwini TaxID=1538125 RepID=A0AAV4WHW1_9ARAC|nr:hypothetical protein CDAR_93001 [Caerostris darwini]
MVLFQKNRTPRRLSKFADTTSFPPSDRQCQEASTTQHLQSNFGDLACHPICQVHRSSPRVRKDILRNTWSQQVDACSAQQVDDALSFYK